MSSIRYAAVTCLLLLAQSAQCQAVIGDFNRGTLDAGWALTGSAALTAPSQDPNGTGWLRLTPKAGNSLGTALQNQGSFAAQRGVTVSFSYAAWGGGTFAGDGVSVFLFDPGLGMAGAQSGGGLGYCRGAGGWLGLALDEFGNFSHPQDHCGNGPGPKPQSLALRGPLAQGNPFVASAAVPGGVDRPASTTRAGAGDVILYLWPKGTGYTLSAHWRADASSSWQPLLDRVDFPFTAPAALSVGAAAGTGAATNVHEIRALRVVPHEGLTAAIRFEPAAITTGSTSTLTLHFGTASRTATFVAPFMHELPGGLRIADVPGLGGTCAASVRAAPGGHSITVEAGSEIRSTGCTIAVRVVAEHTGLFTSTIAMGSLLTDRGTNLEAASANLAINR